MRKNKTENFDKLKTTCLRRHFRNEFNFRKIERYQNHVYIALRLASRQKVSAKIDKLAARTVSSDDPDCFIGMNCPTFILA